MNDEWNNQNAIYRRLSSILLLTLLISISFTFFVFGTSFFIWLTRKNHLSNIKTFKEALNLILNASFIPTLSAMIIGFIQYDITLMLTVQSMGLALMILMIFVKTKFNDSLAKEESSLTNTLT
ncbi:hypothetical protein [Vagococcus sp.]|uniref:hypothetical protein n=1 Tax=Vagococcus sp. TaxID=1933889 RepID=UPI003F9C9F03